MNENLPVQKIISGGQTGVDRGGLDVALALSIDHGGWCPRGRLAEDGVIPQRYQLRETESPQYRFRTEKNVADSNGTLILYRRKLSGGTQYTYYMTRKHSKPCCLVDLDDPSAEDVRQWLLDENVRVLNVAGPRESSHPGIAAESRSFLFAVLCAESV